MTSRRDRSWAQIESDARTMLAQTKRPKLAELVALIHAVNPTARGLTPQQSESRYALKSRLQSVLVRHFGDDLTVVPDPSTPDLVVLRHALLDIDACHAQLAALDDDARAWVRDRLDLGDDTSAASESPCTSDVRDASTSPESPMAAGQRALDAYDYDAARTHFEEACRRAPHASPPVLALLSLLVDTLALDAEARSFAAALPPSLRAHLGVRGFLALADARTGEGTLDLSALDGFPSERADEVMAAHVGRALGRGDVPAARTLLQTLVARSPGHPARDSLERTLAARESDARARVDAALQTALASDTPAQAEVLAREALARWPDHALARKVLRTARERQTAAERDAVTARFELALTARDVASARRSIEALRAMGEDLATPRKRLESLESALRDEEERERLRAVVALAATDVDGAVTELAGMTPALRARAAAVEPLFAPIEQMLRRAGESDEALAAARALRSAQQAFRADEPEHTLSALGPHAAWLRHCAAGRELIERATELHRARQRADAAQRLSTLAAEAHALDPESRAARIGAIQRDHLDAAGAALLSEIEERHAATVARAREIAKFEALEREGDLLAARDLAAALSASETGEERAHWEGVRCSLDAQIASAWRVRVLDGLGDEDEMVDTEVTIREADEPWCALTEDGGRMVHVAANGLWVSVREVDVEQNRVVRRIVLRTPTPLSHPEWRVEGQSLFVIGNDGTFLEMDLSACRVVRWRPLGRLFPTAVLDWSVLAPGGRYVWFDLRDHSERPEQCVIDVQSGRVVRRAESRSMLGLVLGSDLASMVLRGTRGGAAQVQSNGTAARGPQIPSTLLIAGVSAFPGRSGFALLCDREEEGHGVELHHLDASGRLTRGPELSADDEDGLLVPDHGLGEVHVVTHGGADGSSLHSYAWESDGIAPRRTREFIGIATMVCDAACRHVRALHSTEHGIRLSTPQEAVSDGWARSRAVPADLSGTRLCLPAEVFGKKPTLRPKRPAVTAEQVDALLARATPPTAAETARLLNQAQWQVADGALPLSALRDLLSLHRGDRLVALCFGQCATAAGHWDEALHALVRFEQDPERDVITGHGLHLLGLTLLHSGESERARACLARVREVGGRCDIDTLLALAGAPMEHADGWVELRDQLLAFDACRTRGDDAAAEALCEHSLVAAEDEFQAIARRAEFWLSKRVHDASTWSRKFIALSRLPGALGARQSVSELPLGAHTWDGARIIALAERATAWLDAATAPDAPRLHDPTA